MIALVAIDPGKACGLAVLDEHGGVSEARRTP